MKNNNFKISQEFEILQHQKGKAYPISIKEWEFIKNEIKEINVNVNIFYSIGFLFLGASMSGFITIFTTEFKTEMSKYLTCGFVALFLIIGILSVYFAIDKHKQEASKPKEIIKKIELIESRFEK